MKTIGTINSFSNCFVGFLLHFPFLVIIRAKEREERNVILDFFHLVYIAGKVITDQLIIRRKSNNGKRRRGRVGKAQVC